MSPTAKIIASRLDKELRTTDIPDSSLNGLQIEGQRRVRKVALAVDASLATFQAAVRAQADMIVVHHGLFWGKQEKICGRLYQKIRLLIENDIGLYVSHLPLDLHPRLGNNALLAKGLKIQKKRPFGLYHGIHIGVGGNFTVPQTCQQVSQQIEKITKVRPRIFSFGKSKIKKIAIVSGGGGDLVEEAATSGYDAYFTGEIAHPVFHIGQENSINIIAGGHYATETLGVCALGEFVKKIYGIKSVFINLPTGL
jgi:dinuclear metal center YbgI/SA1388 family protein